MTTRLLAMLFVLAAISSGETPKKSGPGNQDPAAACAKPKGNPVCYAHEIELMLAQRVQLLSAEIQRRKTEYDNTARNYEKNARKQVTDNLDLERSRRAEQLTKDILSKRVPATEWKSGLRDYIRADQSQMLGIWLSDVQYGLAGPFVSTIEDLQSDLDKSKKLSDLVHLLATPRNLKDELDQWLSYGNETADAYKKSSCEDVKKKRDDASKKLKEEQGKLSTAQQKTPPDPKEIEALAAEAAALDSQVKGFADYLTGKNCK